MTTNAETAPSEEIPAHDDFVKYPIHKVVSVFTDKSKVNAAVAELREAGYPEADIEAFCGMKAEDSVEFDGVSHGVWSNFVHAARHVGPGRTYLERYERHLSDGDCLVMVKVTSSVRKQRAADILHRHTDERVTYFGLLMADEVQ
jgi:hypothetical protein